MEHLNMQNFCCCQVAGIPAKKQVFFVWMYTGMNLGDKISIEIGI
jgi:hypothetical protein